MIGLRNVVQHRFIVAVIVVIDSIVLRMMVIMRWLQWTDGLPIGGVRTGDLMNLSFA